MKKIIVFNRISIDGFFAGPKGESHEWFVQDLKVDKAAHGVMKPDTVLFGRVTYKIFENYWPKVEMNKNAPTQLRDTAEELTQMKKIVFSKTLKSVKWRNSELVKGNLVAEVKKLKKGNGPDMVIFGSGTIIQQLTVAGLIDEFVLVETPVVLGKGKSFFKDVKKLGLELLKSKDFKSGNVLLHYKVRK